MIGIHGLYLKSWNSPGDFSGSCVKKASDWYYLHCHRLFKIISQTIQATFTKNGHIQTYLVRFFLFHIKASILLFLVRAPHVRLRDLRVKLLIPLKLLLSPAVIDWNIICLQEINMDDHHTVKPTWRYKICGKTSENENTCSWRTLLAKIQIVFISVSDIPTYSCHRNSYSAVIIKVLV